MEVILALGLFAVAAGTVFVLLGSQFKSLEIVRDGTQAISLAEEGLEGARTIRDRDWDLLALGNHGLKISENKWTFEGESDVNEDGYTRSISVSELGVNERMITSTVTWTPSYLRNQTITLTSVLSNWRNLFEPLLSGDWSNPQTLGSVDLGAGESATSIAVRDKFIYLTATANDSKKADFFIVNATNGNNPLLVSSLKTGDGLNSVAISGNYAYVANINGNQLQIIDISNTNNPLLVSSVGFPGNTEDGLSVAIFGQYAYVGSEKSSSQEFYIVNVSNPANPSVVGSLEIDANVNDIAVFGERVFLSTAKDSGEFIVVNVSDPVNPVISASLDILGATEDGKGIYINSQDNKAYLVRTVGGDHDEHHEIAIIDVSSADNPTLLGSSNFGSSVNSVFAADSLGFFATSYSNGEFQIFNVSDPSNIIAYSNLNFSQIATDIAFEDNTVYVSVRSNDALRIITSQ